MDQKPAQPKACAVCQQQVLIYEKQYNFMDCVVHEACLPFYEAHLKAQSPEVGNQDYANEL